MHMVPIQLPLWLKLLCQTESVCTVGDLCITELECCSTQACNRERLQE